MPAFLFRGWQCTVRSPCKLKSPISLNPLSRASDLPCYFLTPNFVHQVIYNAAEFLNKNQDNTSPDVIKLFRKSAGPIAKQLIVKDQV